MKDRAAKLLFDFFASALEQALAFAGKLAATLYTVPHHSDYRVGSHSGRHHSRHSGDDSEDRH